MSCPSELYQIDPVGFLAWIQTPTFADGSLESPPPTPSTSSSAKRFEVGEVIWGPHGGFPSWPGKLLKRVSGGHSKAKVCWFGNKDVSEVDAFSLKSLSDGLEAHHRERKKLRK